MEKITEIVEKLNNLKILQKSMEFTENLDEETMRAYFVENAVEELLDVDKHRWYETSIAVWELPQGYLGVRSVTDVVGESNSVEDMYWTLKFFEMEQIQAVSYKIKKNE
jgi:hypothetical protein